MAARNHIDLVEKTMDVLEALAENKGGANLRTITGSVGLVKSSVFRILYTLKEAGYVHQPTANGTYSLSLKILSLSRKLVSSPILQQVVRPHLIQLKDKVGESAWLAELRRRKVFLIDVVEAPHPLRVSYGVGDECPLHATALGKVIAAHMPLPELKAAIGQGKLPSFTPRTITERSGLRAELAKVCKNGFASNIEESTEGVLFFAAPLFDARENACAAVSVSIPTARCSSQKRKESIAAVKHAAAAITNELVSSGFRALPFIM